jgi:hypothetical protein
MRNPPGLANAEFEANKHGRVMAGVTSPAEFLSEENVGRILAGGTLSGGRSPCLAMAHETPVNSLVRALPSPVCTDRVGRQSRRKRR